MARLERVAVHAIGKERIGIERFPERQAARKRHGLGMIAFRAAVPTFAQHLDGSRLEARLLQHQLQGHAGPFRMANGPRAPLHAVRVRLQERPAVARTFHGRKYRPFGQRRQLVPGPDPRPLHAAADLQAPFG